MYVKTRLPMSGQPTVKMFEVNTQPLSGDLYMKLQIEEKKKMFWRLQADID